MKFIKFFLFIILIGSFNTVVFCEKKVEIDDKTKDLEIENVSYLTVDKALEIALKYNREVLNSNEEFPFLTFELGISFFDAVQILTRFFSKFMPQMPANHCQSIESKFVN